MRYRSPTGEDIPALLLLPGGAGPFPAVVAHHQHNSEWQIGKSEVAGLVGDPHQALGPVLARRGVAVLAPDAVCFEDRRRASFGAPPSDGGWLQHYNEMAYGLLDGRLLMSTILADAALAVSVLAALPAVDQDRVGVIGHSLGGYTSLFHAAVDERVRFACASGAACTYRARIASGTAIEMAQVIPGIRGVADIDDIAGLDCATPAAAPVRQRGPLLRGRGSHRAEGRARLRRAGGGKRAATRASTGDTPSPTNASNS